MGDISYKAGGGWTIQPLTQTGERGLRESGLGKDAVVKTHE